MLVRRAAMWCVLAGLAACAGDTGVVVYNAPPTAAILSPAEGTTVDESTTLTFEGRVSDDGNLAAAVVQWTSDKDGLLTDTSLPDPDGRVEYATANLSPGNHVIGLRVIDDRGEQGATTVSITIIDLPDPPEIDLLTPTQGTKATESEILDFSAVVSDAQDEVTELEVVYLSDQDGFLCAELAGDNGVAACSAPLTSGTHLITAEVEDSDGNRGQATAYVQVVALADADVDEDGWTVNQGDCNDLNEDVRPGAAELPNGIDDDCDGVIDEGTINYDDDGDGYSEVDGDCDDTSRLTYPGATEVEDGEDNDCDGTSDEGTRVYDDDGDGFSEVDGDCNDLDRLINPRATETCDTVDNDCDSFVDEEGASGCSTYWADDDKDSYGDPSDSKCLCAAKAPHNVLNDDDCYDGNSAARPGQISWFGVQRGDGSYDYDCNGTAQKQWESRFSCSGAVWVCVGHSDGWVGSVPACGVTTTWATDCSGTFTSCDPSGTSSRQQTCR